MISNKKTTTIFLFVLLLLFITISSACSSKKVYMINFYLEDDLLYTYSSKEGKYEGEMPIVDDLANYTFQGWFIDKDEWLIPFDRDYEVKNDLDVYAKYIDVGPKKPLSFTVVFDIEGYEEEPLTIIKGTSFILPIPYTEDKIFKNWFFDKDFTKEYKEADIGGYIRSDNVLVLYGKWDEVTPISLFLVSEGTKTIEGLTAEGKKQSLIHVPSQLGEVEIKIIGNRAFANSSLNAIRFGEGIETIDNEACLDSKKLTTVTLPKGLLEIREKAFKNCEALVSINLPNSLSKLGVSAFENCEKLTNNEPNFLPASLKEIAASVFRGCKSLTKINLTYVLTKIGNYAFLDSGVKNIIIPQTVEMVGAGAFKNSKIETLQIQQGVEVISDEAFYGCTNLNKITFKAGKVGQEMILGKSVFYNCSNERLTKIILPDYINSIGVSTFEKCEYLEEITLPNALKKLSSDLFCNAKKLKNITLPSSIVEIGEGVFYDCQALVEITIPQEVTKLKNNVFFGCSSLVKVTFLGEVVLLGISCFESCTNLKTISLESVTSGIVSTSVVVNEEEEFGLLSSRVFYGCKSLENVILNQEIKKIGKEAFANCSKITTFNSQSLVNLETIGISAFKACNKLTKFYLHASVINIEGEAFKIFTPNTENENVFTIFTEVSKAKENWNIGNVSILFNSNPEDFDDYNPNLA